MKGRDVPQTNRLVLVRDIVDAVGAGPASTLEVEQETGVAARHVSYALNTARVLGFLSSDSRSYTPTELGLQLASSEPGSGAERELLEVGIRRSEIVQTVAPTLLDEVGPLLEDVTARIQECSSLSETTAHRRAQTLLSWRRQIHKYQSPGLRLELDSEPESESMHSELGVAAEVVDSDDDADESYSISFSMKPRQMTVGELVKLKRDGLLFLPELQRGFVWNNDRLRALHDSLYRGYPIGALLLWKPNWVDGEVPFSVRPWDLCIADGNGKGQPEKSMAVRPGSVFVLDGQQRLTSIFRVVFDNRGRGSAKKAPISACHFLPTKNGNATRLTCTRRRFTSNSRRDWLYLRKCFSPE